MKKISEKATKIKWDPTVEISGLHSSMPTQLQMAATWLSSFGGSKRKTANISKLSSSMKELPEPEEPPS